jgi:subtilisin-like proprotein convertase family protein/subtilisin family serine protease
LLVVAALSSAVLADADPAPRAAAPAAEPHLILVPQTAAGTVALARADARVVARYRSFTLVEAAGGDDARLRAAGGDRRDDMREVATAAGPIDPAADRASLADKDAPARDEVLALVQFVGPPKDPWLERLRATGARIVTYQAENAYLVHASGAEVDRIAELVGTDPAVRAVIPMTAADKVEAEAAGTARYAVSTLSGGDGSPARDDAAAAGPEVSAPTSVGSLRTQYLELAPDEVERLARDPAVVTIEPDAAPELNDERGAQIVAGNLNAFLGPSAPSYLAWHNARFAPPFNFAIDVTDSGVDDGTLSPDHPDFYEQGSTSNPDRIDYMTDYTGGMDAPDCTGHGTSVASIAAGYNSGTGPANEDTSGYNHGLGVAPLVQIGASRIFDCTGQVTASLDPAAITSSAYANDARISNNSWGTGTVLGWGSYTGRSALYDQLVRDAQSGTSGNQQMVEVFSAGNDGDGNSGAKNEGYATVSLEGSAKNVITVGASEGVRASGTDGCGTTDAEANVARDIASFSSRGPTDDGRLKPDLVAPGTHVTGARSPTGIFNPALAGTCTPFFADSYSLISGTSQAAPHVAGAAALVRDWYLNNVPGGVVPSPAMTKALLINTATDLAGGDNGKGVTVAGGPNEDQGWGRVNLGSALDSTSSRGLYDQVATFDASTDAPEVHSFIVPNASKPVKVTLVWTDPPGSTMGNAFVNNLDLEVTAAGRLYRGNVFSGSWSRTGGAADFRNNVESVYLPPGTGGRFSVAVRPTTIAGNGVPNSGDGTDQDFALVVSNATEQAAPVLAHEATTVVDTVPGGDGDGALESDEYAALNEQVRNTGPSTATGPQAATLTGVGGLSVFAGSATYAAMGSGATASNAPSFGVHLANAATCGADASATLAISTSAGTQTVPVVVPTGAPGAVGTNVSTQVPVAIPDDSPAGAASSVFVPERGRIKDLNVSVGGIAHSWVGDLQIDITGPDGTTVRLADHPGGPNNQGDNFSGTVFDDEAATNIAQGTPPYAGYFRAQNDQLSRFDGKSRRGTWTLRVRDLFEGDTGTLTGWGLASQKALCNIDTTPPDTTFASAPGNPTPATSATFRFGSNDGGATFECALDGAAYEPCAATRTFGGLALGSHTVRARAIDGSDNEDPSPASYTWRIEPVPPPAASFVVAPAEARLADVLDGRYSVLAACASACRASAKVSVGAKTARRLGLGRRAVTLGSKSSRRGSGGTAKVAVKLSRRARAALRGRALTKATLTVTLTEGGSKLTVKRTVSVRRAAGLQRIASRGMKLWAACVRRCPLGVELTLSAAQARKLGLKPGKAKRYELGSRRTAATRRAKMLSLTIRRSARRALSRARRVSALLEAVAGTAPDPVRVAKLSTTLRR